MTPDPHKVEKVIPYNSRRVFLPVCNETEDGRKLEQLVHSKTVYERLPNGSLKKLGVVVDDSQANVITIKK